MTEWTCPKCGGGFPHPRTCRATGETGNTFRVATCPWCANEMVMHPSDVEELGGDGS